MRQIWIPKHGVPEIMELREAPDPQPGSGEVRVRVEYSGLNFADVVSRMGMYLDAPKPPFVPGLEASGIVDAIGEGVSGDWLSAPVIALVRFGSYSDVICIPISQVTRRPNTISSEIAAALPVTALTAYQALVVMGSVRPGDQVLIHGAGGGVGWIAVQMAHLLGATVYGTASTSKHAALYELGVKACIDYHTTDFVKAIRNLTNIQGVEVVLDPIGGSHWWRSYQALAPTGRLIMCGQAGAVPGKKRSLISALKWVAGIPWLRFNPVQLLNDNKMIGGINLGRMWDQIDRMQPWMEQCLAWCADGKLSPRIDQIYPLEQAAAAHHRLQDHQNIGKVLLKA